MTHRGATRHGPEDGAVAVEAALTITMLMLLIYGIVQFSYAFWYGHSLLLAISQVGRSVMVSYAPDNTHCDTTCAEGRLRSLVPNATVSASNSDPNCSGGMMLRASYTVNVIGVSVPISPRMCVPLL